MSELDKNYYAPPAAASLPKGGGAIKGMGEKFAANPVTGTGSISVPIATSPGRSGFGPQLALSYDSGAGTGIFGFGWNLSLPAMTRKTDKGLPRYSDGENSDVFILSGAEDLVPVLVQNKQGEWESEKLLPRKVGDQTYTIQRYRPRIEGLFARIERWTNQAEPNDTFWRSLSKDNITTWYGRTENSRIFDPADPTRIFSWLICESYDDKGNVIAYRYQEEDAIQIDLSKAHERNRMRSANRYLKSICYGNHQPYRPQIGEGQPWPTLPGDDQWFFEVVFDYGEHDPKDPKPDDGGEWPCRLDPFSSYRSGFEVRTYRLCQRVLMFHHFPDEAELGRDCLVRSTDFTYSYEQNPTDVRNPIYSFLLSATQMGYKRNPGGGYIQKSLPPLEFTYSEAKINETVRDVELVSLENLPQGLDGARYQWVDLDGEGLSGILTEQRGGWFYKRNLSPIHEVRENGKTHVEAIFAPVERVASKPAVALSGGAQFLDLAGDGQPDVVTLRGAAPGFHERTQEAGWENFVAFKSLPVLDWENPNLKFIDLNGDGHSDILITEDNCFVWHPSLAEDGFAAEERVHQPWDEEKGPRVVFADSTQSIHLADMSGDGLSDIVRIRNGEMCYWPNLGYGRFGAKVTMDHAPWFDRPDIFDQRRIVLADIDGSGTTDILYLSGLGVQVYFNQSGNGWSAKQVLKSFPAIDNVASVTAIDLLGNGTACLVWSSPLPGDVGRSMRYIDLMGGQKPHLLIKTVNNLGAETVVEYAPSSKFYLQDKLEGTPWITKLPFPVHVVERVETYDRISRNRFVTRYAYHHGYFDGVEREFRGFGMVEQWDTEEIGTIQPGETTSESTNLDVASFVPPVYTKTWFHNGAYIAQDKISHLFTHEYYQGDAQATPLPDTVMPDGLTVDEERESCRALKGSILRQEVYAADGTNKSPHPYSVSERNYTIAPVQPKGNNRHSVFFVHPRETIDYHYERNPADPRITHAMTLEVDEFGNVLKSVALGYPRRNPQFPEQGQIETQPTKGKPLITYTENQVTNEPNQADWYRIGVSIETRTYEITGLEVIGLPSFVPYTLDLIHNKLKEIEQRLQEPDPKPKPEIAYEEFPSGGIQRRLVEQVRTLYRPNDQANTADSIPLALGNIESLALPCESFKLAFTPGLLSSVYQRSTQGGAEILLPDQSVLESEGRYIRSNTYKAQGYFSQSDPDDCWWIPSGRQAFGPNQFYLPVQTKDPFGNVYTSTYDNYHLTVIQTVDPLNNTIAIRSNYRTLQPEQITDPNGNRSQVRFDALGMVVGTAILGKESENQGDSFANFNEDLSRDEIKAFFDANNPRSLAINHLGTATTCIIYDLDLFQDSGQPVCAAAIARETHVSDLAANQLTKVHLSFVYSDGFGREAQTKVQAEAGPLDPGGPNSPMLDPRWVGTGAKVYNNKGKPIKQYEPFFSPTHHFGIELCGVSSTLFYDPVERVVATLHPNQTWEKVVFDPWQQTTYDVNDTITFDPKTDADVQEFLTRLPDQDYLPTWYQQRLNGSLGTEEQAAAEKAANHADTPTIAHFDTLGRTFLIIADNGKDASGQEQQYRTRVELDIEGNQRAVIDANDRVVMRYDYDMLGDRIHQISMEAGDLWMLNTVAGHPMRLWDSRDHILRTTYDELLRPTQLFVKTGTQPEILTEKTVYGEGQGDTQNHRGRIYKHFDSAGVITNQAFDFKGNLERSTRQLVQNYTTIPDWSANPAPALETEIFSSSTRYDVMNRPIQLVVPHSNRTDTKLNVIRPNYNEANLLERVDVWLGETAEPTVLLNPDTTNFHPVTNIDYNAKGQRTQIEYGNGVKTDYTYDDNTFRLTRLRTVRANDGARLQGLNYTYDPVGNITRIRDDVQQTIYFNNQVVLPQCDYTYDAIYRLIEATGREHIGQVTQPETTWNDEFHVNLPHPNDGQAMRNYTEQYIYDSVGNFELLIHQAANGTWTRSYAYTEASLIEPDKQSDRLSSTTVGQRTEPYSYDAHGNMTSMPHLTLMQWNYKDQLGATARQAVNDLPPNTVPETTFYVYDAGGQRTRKVTERQNGTRKHERIYLGGFEIYREFSSDGKNINLERETLHVTDDQQRIALAETKTIDNPDDESPGQFIRYQFSNHLGSSSLELDDQANVISYEEYTPYGSTSYQAVDKMLKASAKRYRYMGKECDEETGLSYYGARYYAPWLGRWTCPDPHNLADSTNDYQFTKLNPIRYIDQHGTDSNLPKIGPIREGMLISDDPGLAARWQIAVERTLARMYPHLKTYEERLAHFKNVVSATPKGSNKSPGTPINIARNAYSSARAIFGSLVTLPKGSQVHHAFPGQGVANNPPESLNATHLELTTGQAKHITSTHGRATRAAELVGKVDNPGLQATREMELARAAKANSKPVVSEGTGVKSGGSNKTPGPAQENPAVKGVGVKSGSPSKTPGLGQKVGGTVVGTAKAFAPMAIAMAVGYLRDRNYQEAAELRANYIGWPTEEQISRQWRAGWKFTGEVDENNKPVWKYDAPLVVRLRDAVLFAMDPPSFKFGQDYGKSEMQMCFESGSCI